MTSRILAPFSTCSSAISTTRSNCPWRSCSCNAFLPVGLILSPTMVNVPSREIDVTFLSVVKVLSLAGTNGLNICSFKASFRQQICSGVVPQHPPNTVAPASASFFIAWANSSGPISYTVSPSTSAGRPALGFTITGTLANRFMLFTASSILSGPVEQLIPTASTPISCKTTIAVSGLVPYKVLPSS